MNKVFRLLMMSVALAALRAVASTSATTEGHCSASGHPTARVAAVTDSFEVPAHQATEALEILAAVAIIPVLAGLVFYLTRRKRITLAKS